jgi:tetratricopeptide (TPR) repeat protein
LSNNYSIFTACLSIFTVDINKLGYNVCLLFRKINYLVNGENKENIIMAKEKVIDKLKQKQQDEVFKSAVDDFDRFEDFFSNNLKSIIISFSVLAIVIAIGAVAYTKFEQAKLKVSSELTAAKTVDELKAAIAKHPDNLTVFPAQLKLGTLYFNDGKFKEALEVYTKVSNDAPKGEIKNQASLNTAYTLEALNKPIEAADKFAMIGANPTLPEYIRNEANFSAGRIYNAEKKSAKAKNCLKSIDFKKAGLWAAQGEKLLQRIN